MKCQLRFSFCNKINVLSLSTIGVYHQHDMC